MTNSPSLNKIDNWKNSDNLQFHKQVPIEILKNFTVLGGLNNCCDVAQIKSLIINEDSILEVGAGYGRVLDSVLQMGYKGNLYALERCSKFCHLLLKKYNKDKKVIIFQDDINNFETTLQFKVILWLWCGISEFNKNEQLPILKKLFSFLKEEGILIVETIPLFEKTLNTTSVQGQYRAIEAEYGRIYTYFPSHQEFLAYGKEFNNCTIEMIRYQTETKKTRDIYIYKKTHKRNN